MHVCVCVLLMKCGGVVCGIKTQPRALSLHYHEAVGFEDKNVMSQKLLESSRLLLCTAAISLLLLHFVILLCFLFLSILLSELQAVQYSKVIDM